MKKEIHPKYFDKTKISCACGAMFEVGSTIENMEVEICSQCHPFYTGKERGSDKVGRVQKFKERAAKQKK
jgi:large subunit ribosomal protein L31